jgi:hypothetical protein
MPKINRYWNSDPDSLVEWKPPQTYDLCKCCELVNQLLWKEKRLKRELWIARAKRAKAMKAVVNLDNYLSLHENSKWFRIYATRIDTWYYKWDDVERKCHKKAEEYK